MSWIDLVHDELDRNCQQNYDGDRNIMLAYYLLNQPKLLRDASQILHQQRWIAKPTVEDCKFFIFEQLCQSSQTEAFIEKYEVLLPKDILELYLFYKTPEDHRERTLQENKKIFRNISWCMHEIEWFVHWLKPIKASTAMPFLINAIEKSKNSECFGKMILTERNNWIGKTMDAIEQLTMLNIMPITKQESHTLPAYTLSIIEQKIFSNLFIRSKILEQQTGPNPIWNHAMLSHMSNVCPDLREWNIFANLIHEIKQDDLLMQIQNLQNKAKMCITELNSNFPETTI